MENSTESLKEINRFHSEVAFERWKFWSDIRRRSPTSLHCVRHLRLFPFANPDGNSKLSSRFCVLWKFSFSIFKNSIFFVRWEIQMQLKFVRFSSIRDCLSFVSNRLLLECVDEFSFNFYERRPFALQTRPQQKSSVFVILKTIFIAVFICIGNCF
jgi:hypothetical protein